LDLVVAGGGLEGAAGVGFGALPVSAGTGPERERRRSRLSVVMA
jgi:hypothetical protein